MSKRDPELDASRGTICTPTGMKVVDGKYYLSLILMFSSLVFPLESGVFLFESFDIHQMCHDVGKNMM